MGLCSCVSSASLVAQCTVCNMCLVLWDIWTFTPGTRVLRLTSTSKWNILTFSKGSYCLLNLLQINTSSLLQGIFLIKKELARSQHMGGTSSFTSSKKFRCRNQIFEKFLAKQSAKIEKCFPKQINHSQSSSYRGVDSGSQRECHLWIISGELWCTSCSLHCTNAAILKLSYPLVTLFLL